MQNTYQVDIAGVKKDVPDVKKTIKAFAKTFSISEPKAKRWLTQRRTIKKGLEKSKAELLCKKLNAMGVLANVSPEVFVDETKKTVQTKAASKAPLKASTNDIFGGGFQAGESNLNSHETTTNNSLRGELQASENTQSDEKNKEEDASIGSGNVSFPVKVRSSFFSILSIEPIEGLTLLGIIITLLIAAGGVWFWSYSAVDSNHPFNPLAVFLGGAIGITVLLVSDTSISSGTFAMILAICAIILTRHLIFTETVDNIFVEIGTEQRELLERRQSLLQNYDSEMSDEAFVAFYRNFNNGPIDLKYRSEIRESNEEIIFIRPLFEERVPAILDMSYEKDIKPGFEKSMAAAGPVMDELKPEFFGTSFLIYLTFGALAAFRFGMGFG